MLVEGDRFAVVTQRERYEDLVHLGSSRPATGGRPDARRTDGRHARPHPGDRGIRAADAGGGRRDAHPRRRLLRTVRAAADRGGEHVAGRRVRQERRRHPGPARQGHGRLRRRAVRGPAQLRARRPAHPRRARHRRRAAAQHRGPQHRGARLHAPAGDEDPRRHAASSIRARRAAGCTARRRPRSSISTRSRWSSSVSTPLTGRHDGWQPHPHHRLRLAVHAAHRAPSARGARLLGDPSADAQRRVDPRLEADRHHPQRRPELRLRRERADGRPGDVRRRARPRRLLRDAAHRASAGERGEARRAARVWPRRDPADGRECTVRGLRPRARRRRCG